jgi:hypothetical protein
MQGVRTEVGFICYATALLVSRMAAVISPYLVRDLCAIEEFTALRRRIYTRMPRIRISVAS